MYLSVCSEDLWDNSPGRGEANADDGRVCQMGMVLELELVVVAMVCRRDSDVLSM